MSKEEQSQIRTIGNQGFPTRIDSTGNEKHKKEKREKFAEQARQQIGDFEDFEVALKMPSTIENLSDYHNAVYQQSFEVFSKLGGVEKPIRFCLYLLSLKMVIAELLEDDFEKRTANSGYKNYFGFTRSWWTWFADDSTGVLVKCFEEDSFSEYKQFDYLKNECEDDFNRLVVCLLGAYTLHLIYQASKSYGLNNMAETFEYLGDFSRVANHIGQYDGWIHAMETIDAENIEKSSMGGKARHRKSPIADCKKIALELSNKYIKNPYFYKSQVEFAKDVLAKAELNKIKVLPNEEVIKRWHRLNVLEYQASASKAE
jgi:hypothetical protein